MENYHIASITKDEEIAVKKAEEQIKQETGKEFVIIAWEKE